MLAWRASATNVGVRVLGVVVLVPYYLQAVLVLTTGTGSCVAVGYQ
jgi:hypothetical protein